jgi:hypothetical protein
LWGAVVGSVGTVVAALASQLVHDVALRRAVWVGMLVVIAVGEGVRRAAAETLTEHPPEGGRCLPTDRRAEPRR